MHAKVKHSKVRNTGLLFEFLLRQITTDVLNKKNNSGALRLIKQRFNEGCELGKELALYNALLSKKFNNDKKAEYFINEVLTERHKLNKGKLRRERYNLIKALKEGYNVQELFSTKIKNYKTYASIYKLFEYSNLRPEEKTESFFNIVEHVTTKENTIKLTESLGGVEIPKNSELRILTYKTLLEKFNQKYTKLNQKQKGLLREYINNVSNSNSLKKTLIEIVNELKIDLKTHSKKLQDKVVKIKMNEAMKSIDKFCGLQEKTQFVKDAHVLQTMRYMELLKELKKSGQKSTKK
jgi:hypothetical protein